MTHTLIIKFKEGIYNQEVFDKTYEAFSEMVEKISGVNSFKLIENIIDRDANGDILLIIELQIKEMLQVYLDHPLHVAYANYIAPITEKKVSLDY